jgi:mannose-6-phosphate isomerase
MLYPLLLEPTLHIKVWGGRRLESVLHKSLATDDPYGESWELHDTSIVANGPHAGQSIAALLTTYGPDLVGPGNDPADGFPLLIKLIDAARWLSVQVHPDDAQAAELEGQPRGKTEAWVILDATAESELVIGVQPGTDRDRMARAIQQNTLEDLLVRQKVKPDDVLFIPAGTIHAIGPGILLYEVQQSSDTTYRLYDWGRVGLDGKPRELHIEKGVQVCNVETLPTINTMTPDKPVVTCPFFQTDYHRLVAGDTLTLDTAARAFHALTCIDGALKLQAGMTQVDFEQGRTVLVPAATGSYTLTGQGAALRSYPHG